MLKIKAAAKINLSLDIVGVREDGYHLLETIMQSVDLFDEISISLTNESISVISSNADLGDKNDIAYRAAELFLKEIGSDKGVEITINKNIPLSAGLGGGSADAAAVILGLNKLFGNPINTKKLTELALKIGADVPYFLYGGTVLVSGIGEICTPITSLPDCYIVLAKKEEKKSTKYMYSLIDNCKENIHIDTAAIVSAIENNDINTAAKMFGNSFSLAWDNTEIKEITRKFNPIALSLSGSGPTYFVVFRERDSADNCTKALIDNGYQAFTTQPVSKAIIFE